jgi:hypothetical protein
MPSSRPSPPRSASTGASTARTSRAPSPTPACWPARASSSDDECDAIVAGLERIRERIAAGTFEWSVPLEDVHMNIEAALTADIGDAGKRLHTGRSRNDQVATDIRLWLRDEIDAIRAGIDAPAARCSTSPSARPTPSCPASPTCRSRSPSPSAIT